MEPDQERKEYQTDIGDLLNPMKFTKYDPSRTHQFSAWYNTVVEGNAAVKQAIVESDPNLAVRIVETFRDVGLGRLFVEFYRNDPKYGRIAEHVEAKIKSQSARLPRNVFPRKHYKPRMNNKNKREQ